MPHSERVAAAHALYLHLESTGLAMHTGGLAIFDARPFTRPDGALEIERIEPILEEFLVQLPHARQRLRYVPFEQHPVWIDDDRFRLPFHVRHTRLPRPGTERQLKRLVGRLMSEPLDRHKPLWETWVIEGLDGDRLAIMLKVHPGVLEAVAVPALFANIGRRAAAHHASPGERWRPRKAPAPAQMIADSLVHWAVEGRAAVNEGGQALRHPLTAMRTAVQGADAFLRVVAEAVTGGRAPLLNPPAIGGHRRVEMLHVPLAQVEQVADAIGCEALDVALAALCAAITRFLAAHGEKLEGERLRVLLSLPAATSRERERASASPQTMRVMLPAQEMAATRRAAEVARLRAEALRSTQVEGFDVLERLEAWTPALIQKAAAYAAGRRGAANLVVHFLDGPREPIPLLETTVQSITVFAPLFIDQALCVSIVRSCGLLSFGFNSDWDLLPALHELSAAVDAALAELATASASAVAGDASLADDASPGPSGGPTHPSPPEGAEEGRTA